MSPEVEIVTLLSVQSNKQVGPGNTTFMVREKVETEAEARLLEILPSTIILWVYFVGVSSEARRVEYYWESS